MKWAFIDYENVGCLGKVDLSQYEKVFVFIGATQSKLSFGETKYAAPIDLTILTLQITQSNNLDFHLSYYLGKYNEEAAGDVVFEVISNDNGFSPLIAHIRANGRQCKQAKIKNTLEAEDKLINSLLSKPVEKRPQRVDSLCNHIAAHMKIQGNEVSIRKYLNQLVHTGIVTVAGDGVKYQC